MVNQAFEIGRIIVKSRGREIGQKGVILGFVDQNYVLITGAKLSTIRRRRANIRHLEALDKKIDIKENTSDEDVSAKLKTAKLDSFMKEEFAFKV
ncbi:MAG TPA: 50S ribosomal protein L14e, partial [Candidatus Hodarchaeales archaeon]|nr:50S ribosomal protein L14e [Candidatus Hodarchaeales archaeon]